MRRLTSPRALDWVQLAILATGLGLLGYAAYHHLPKPAYAWLAVMLIMNGIAFSVREALDAQ